MKTIQEMMHDKRKAEYEAEQVEMLLSLDPAKFKAFVEKHRQAAPPSWDDVVTIQKAMHMRRVVCKQLEMPERMKSVRYILSVGIKLPHTVLLQGDAMTGKLVDVG